MCSLALSNQCPVQVFHKSKCRRGWFKISGRCYPILGRDPILKKPHLKKKSNCPSEINRNKALGFWRWNTLLWSTLIPPLLAQGSLSLASSRRKIYFKVCFACTGIDNKLSYIFSSHCSCRKKERKNLLKVQSTKSLSYLEIIIQNLQPGDLREPFKNILLPFVTSLSSFSPHFLQLQLEGQQLCLLEANPFYLEHFKLQEGWLTVFCHSENVSPLLYATHCNTVWPHVRMSEASWELRIIHKDKESVNQRSASSSPFQYNWSKQAVNLAKKN